MPETSPCIHSRGLDGAGSTPISHPCPRLPWWQAFDSGPGQWVYSSLTQWWNPGMSHQKLGKEVVTCGEGGPTLLQMWLRKRFVLKPCETQKKARLRGKLTEKGELWGNQVKAQPTTPVVCTTSGSFQLRTSQETPYNIQAEFRRFSVSCNW